MSLEHDAALLDTLFSSAPFGLALLDRDLRFVRVNPVLAEINGLSPSEHLGKRVCEVLPGLPAGRIEGNWRRIVETGEPMLNVDVSGETPAAPGSRRHWSADYYPLRSGDAIVGICSVVREVTAEREAEAARTEAETMLRALVARLDSVREEEKKRISRDLHDEMGQLLTALRLELESLESGVEALDDAASAPRLLDHAVSASELVTKAIRSMHELVTFLRPAALDRLGLNAALRQECRRFQDRAGVACELVADDDAPGLGPEIDTALFRIAQEALTNVARHARASRVSVAVEVTPGEVSLHVSDDGRGLPPQPAQSTRLGIVGMRERVARLGGVLTLGAGPRGGTTVSARIPFGRARQPSAATVAS